MDYQTAKFYWDTAELALKAGTELDRSRHGRSQEVEVTVQNLLKSLQAAVELSPDRGSISEFEAVFELYRAVISPGPSPYLRTTSDLVKAISAFNDGWLAQLRSPTEAELYSMMRTSLDIHQFCLSRALGLHSQEGLGFAA